MGGFAGRSNQEGQTILFCEYGGDVVLDSFYGRDCYTEPAIRNYNADQY